MISWSIVLAVQHQNGWMNGCNICIHEVRFRMYNSNSHNNRLLVRCVRRCQSSSIWSYFVTAGPPRSTCFGSDVPPIDATRVKAREGGGGRCMGMHSMQTDMRRSGVEVLITRPILSAVRRHAMP